MLPLLLASASPRRRELLERVGVPLEVCPVEIDERPLSKNENPQQYVARLAHAKAEAAVSAARPGQWVLGADTTVTIDGEILGKADSEAEARAMLVMLSGRIHYVMTGWSITSFDRARFTSGCSVTAVNMVAMSEDVLAGYIASGEWRGKAGAYAIQGIGAALVTGVNGSVTNVIGLPLTAVLDGLRFCGAPCGDLARGTPA
jgi:septum formation protein